MKKDEQSKNKPCQRCWPLVESLAFISLGASLVGWLKTFLSAGGLDINSFLSASTTVINAITLIVILKISSMLKSGRY